jgi:hypothetical protein
MVFKQDKWNYEKWQTERKAINRNLRDACEVLLDEKEVSEVHPYILIHHVNNAVFTPSLGVMDELAEATRMLVEEREAITFAKGKLLEVLNALNIYENNIKGTTDPEHMGELVMKMAKDFDQPDCAISVKAHLARIGVHVDTLA